MQLQDQAGTETLSESGAPHARILSRACAKNERR